MLQVSPAFAQSSDPPSFRLEAGVGVIWMGREPIGARTATETTGAGGTSPLFTTSSELAGAAGFAGRLGVRLTRSLVAEAEASYLKPQLRIALSADSEGAAAVTASETIQQFTIGGNVRWMLPGRWWSPRLAPFALGGGGYLRQLHDQATLVETGRFYQVGAASKRAARWRGGDFTRGAGVRVDVRALIRSKGSRSTAGRRRRPPPAFRVCAFCLRSPTLCFGLL